MAGKFGMKKGRSAKRLTLKERKSFGLISDKQIDKQREDILQAEMQVDEAKRKKEERRKMLIERYGIRE